MPQLHRVNYTVMRVQSCLLALLDTKGSTYGTAIDYFRKDGVEEGVHGVTALLAVHDKFRIFGAKATKDLQFGDTPVPENIRRALKELVREPEEPKSNGQKITLVAKEKAEG